MCPTWCASAPPSAPAKKARATERGAGATVGMVHVWASGSVPVFLESRISPLTVPVHSRETPEFLESRFESCTSWLFQATFRLESGQMIPDSSRSPMMKILYRDRLKNPVVFGVPVVSQWSRGGASVAGAVLLVRSLGHSLCPAGEFVVCADFVIL